MLVSEMAALISFFVIVAFILRTALETMRRMRAQRLQMEMFNKLFDRAGTGKEVLDYMQSEAGQKLLESTPVDKTATHGRIFIALQTGIVVTCVASGLLILRPLSRSDAQEPLMVFGTIGLTLGLGLLAASGASLWLSRSLGLINGRDEKR